MWRKIRHIFSYLFRNYYLLTGIVFFVWMLFFDSNNFINQYKNRQELKQLLAEKQYYVDEIKKNKDMVDALTDSKDTRALEKWGREKYLMKRPNEQIFLIIHEEDSTDRN
jgi:cell division protein FtsB